MLLCRRRMVWYPWSWNSEGTASFWGTRALMSLLVSGSLFLRPSGEHTTPPFHQMIDPMSRGEGRREQSSKPLPCSAPGTGDWVGEENRARGEPGAECADIAGGGKGYLSLLAFMKLGPCLRNSVVSPKSGHPIVPGGRPRRRLYRTSFHRSSRLLASTAAARTATNNSTAISLPLAPHR